MVDSGSGVRNIQDESMTSFCAKKQRRYQELLKLYQKDIRIDLKGIPKA